MKCSGSGAIGKNYIWKSFAVAQFSKLYSIWKIIELASKILHSYLCGVVQKNGIWYLYKFLQNFKYSNNKYLLNNPSVYIHDREHMEDNILDDIMLPLAANHYTRDVKRIFVFRNSFFEARNFTKLQSLKFIFRIVLHVNEVRNL